MSSVADGVRVNRRAFPIRSLGPGSRAVIWTQGCHLRCGGCMSPHTWTSTGGKDISVADLVDWVSSLPADQLDGVTISGGEPTEQPNLPALLLGIRRALGKRAVDILVYTGREPDWVQTQLDSLFAGADAVMSGPYDQTRAGRSPLRGSENQELHMMTPLGQLRYEATPLPERRQVEFTVDEGQVYLVGIPLPGAMKALADAAAAEGIALRGAAWRS